MFIKEISYTLNDVTVIPKTVSSVSSRSECSPIYDCNPDHEDGMSPLFASPMLNIINDENFECFLKNKINIVLPRDDERKVYSERKQRWEKYWNKVFVALSLNEFKEYFIEERNLLHEKTYVCIDLANGHMKKLINMCATAKLMYGDKLVLMAGNVANPETYYAYATAGIDYIRIGIGTGSICTTAANSAIHYPMASLIDECYKRKKNVEAWVTSSRTTEYKSVPKIIADGGFTNFDQIIKALALGADYCMCGKLFAQCIEACTSLIADKDFTLPSEADCYPDAPRHSTVRKPYDNVDFVLELMDKGYNFRRDYYGMSTKRAQREMGGKGNKTAEGIAIQIKVDHTVAGWMDNFISFLKSAMSYTDFRSLEDFIGSPEVRLCSNNAFNAYFK